MDLIGQVELPNGRRTTNLGFGCAQILRLYASHQREYLLKTAVDAGITHFDLARAYAMGTAEGIFGSSLHSVRDQITIATKFGLPYQTPAGSSLKIQSLARSILNLSPSFKRGVKAIVTRAAVPGAPAESRNDYSIQGMEQSLRKSLQQLRTDRVDLFFVHAPSIRDSIPEDLGEALRRRKASGEIGGFGVSCSRPDLEQLLKSRPDLCEDAIQYGFSTITGESGSALLHRSFTGMFEVLSGFQLLEGHLSQNESFRKYWSSQLGLDLSNRENAGIVMIAIAITLNPRGVVLFSTSKPKRLRRTVQCLKANSFSSDGLLAFRTAACQAIYAN